jgi:hypothetical protein
MVLLALISHPRLASFNYLHVACTIFLPIEVMPMTDKTLDQQRREALAP